MNTKNFKLADLPEKGMEEAKKSGTDWLIYIEKHPIQTIFFGLIGYFAVKGLNK